jgi:hypothetical protein
MCPEIVSPFDPAKFDWAQFCQHAIDGGELTGMLANESG